MLKRLGNVCLVVVVIASLLFLAGGAYASPGDKEKGKVDLSAPHVPGRLLVKFKGGVDLDGQNSVHSLHGGVVVNEIPEIGVQVVEAPTGKLGEVLAGYLSDSRVEYAEPDYLAQGDFTPDDEYYASRQYGPQITQADQAWDITMGDPSVIVAVVDSGADFSHPDLQGKLVAGWDYVNNDADPADDNGHGTHVAGTIAAATNNGQGVAGIGCDTRVLVVKVLDQNNAGSYSNIAAGIVYAANQGAGIINLSLGGTTWSMTLWQTVEYAWGKGSLLVAAAGNNNSSAPYYPAAYDHVMGVSATDANDQRWSLSNYGNYVSVAAPGKGIFSTDWLGGAGPYAARSGTSMAAPHVSGVAALLLAQDSSRTNADLRGIIESSADDLGDPGWDPYFGYGRVNAYAALTGSGMGAQATYTNCFPSCVGNDGKFAAITAGAGYSTLAMEPLSFFVTTAQPQLNLGIFDPDISGLWDYFGSQPGNLAFRLYADPSRTGDPGFSMGLVDEWFSTDLVSSDNAWFDISMPNAASAFDGSQYVYLLVASQEDTNAVSIGALKVGVGSGDGLELTPDATFGFIGAAAKESDLAVLYPDWPNSLTGATYDGGWTFNLNVTAPPGGTLNEVAIWDGDLDYGDGTVSDSDDVDSGHVVPGFSTSPDALAQGAQGAGAPGDNNDFMFQGLPVFLRGAPITYELVDPNGVHYLNSNPSGNREWEQFRVRALSHPSGCDDDGLADGNPSDDADFCVSSLTPGTWQLNVMGADLSNLNFFHFGFSVVPGG